MRRLAFPLAFRLFFAYAAYVALGGWFVLSQVIDEVKPAVRQSTEETLVDTAHLLAEIVADDVARGTLMQTRWPQVLEKYGQRRPGASIWGIDKGTINHRVYVVDRQGTVLLDSAGRDVGADYSKWNDVYLTLRGKYGARSTPTRPDDPSSSVMYIAAPVYHQGAIIGAVTVAKPNHTTQPFIEKARRRLTWLAAGVVFIGLGFGALLSFWLARSVARLTRYAEAVSAGARPPMPQLPAGELSHLAEALESMRTELEGKNYVERYVQTLTHELKSPLSAIRGAAELLHGEMPRARRDRFLTNIETETARLESLSERLLLLAQVEKRRALEEQQAISLDSLVQDVVDRCLSSSASHHIEIAVTIDAQHKVTGERFLLAQALSNLLDNAIEYTPNGERIEVISEASSTSVTFKVKNQGPPIPDYALGRVMERFYSLPRPRSGRKSTGLGLSFVKEVAELHGGSFVIENCADGVVARLELPQSSHQFP